MIANLRRIKAIPPFIPYRAIFGAACLVVGLAVLPACDNTVDPFAQGGGHPFALFGYLDSAADTQFVRVSRVRSDEVLSGGVGDPPIVTTTELQTGQSVTWRDSVVVLDDGSFGRIYFSSFDVQTGATYRMDVRDEGASPTQAFTSVPSTSGIVAFTPQRNRFGDLEQALLWKDLPRAREAHVHYRVRGMSSGADTTIAISYVGLGNALTNGWTFDVTLDRDTRLVRRFAEQTIGDTSLVLLDVSMSLESPSEEWTVIGETSNIENGSGFFASVGRFRESWSLDSTIVRSIGYRTP